MERKKKTKFSAEATRNYTSIGGTPHLDGEYTVFGEVIEGIEVVDKIAATKTQSGDRPVKDIFIIKASIMKNNQTTQEQQVDEIIPFEIVEEKPKFQGKEASEFTKWIYSKLEYPQVAHDNNIQGTVRVSFTVNTDGTLSDIKSIRKIDPLLENTVIEIIKQSPKWTPGRQQKKPVRVPYQVPIVFKLQ
jgi:TonB family protein